MTFTIEERSRLPASLNYHHLQYFWAVARDGNLTRTARRLRVAQSALSAQIRQLEDRLGQPLFARQRRSLELTEAGRMALTYADEIFQAGDELLSTLRVGRSPREVLRIGAVATLSRNFQEAFVRPLFDTEGVQLRFVSASLDELRDKLERHELDLVLANRPIQSDDTRAYRCVHVARQKVSLVARGARRPFRFPRDLASYPLLLPGPESEVRTSFDALCSRLGLAPKILAEVDDMAMLRLLARDTDALALLPPVVVRDELRSKVLHECCVVPDLWEDFYAITATRRYPHPLLEQLLSPRARELLGEVRPAAKRRR
jgi:LysR family transcriptional regulator, transcriptional activator of nhaA